jgi:hypothetical protein
VRDVEQAGVFRYRFCVAFSQYTYVLKRVEPAH